MTDQSLPPLSAGLYGATATIHPRRVEGRHRRRKTAIMVFALAVLILGPWLRWDRGPGQPDQAALFDFVAMRGYFLDAELWPQDFYFLTGLLVIAAIGLFLVTALYGRVWCGFACPQTIWTDLFVWIECMIEGDRNARIRLDRAPFSPAKVARRALKHGLWLALSLLTGASFVFYFTDTPTALGHLLDGEASEALVGFIVLFTLTTYALAGWAREQVCIYMCPWPRIQGAMLDGGSVIVGYDRARGEGRTHAKIGQSFAGRGHCVDCSLCVQVCPVGIDIRDGLQMECIGCGLCVDACDGVMDRFGLPRALVGWRGLAAEEGPTRAWFRRPRVVLYAAILAGVTLALVVAAGRRAMVDVSVLHDRSPLSVMLADGSVRNDYTVKIVNRDRIARVVGLSLSGLPGATLSVAGEPETARLTAAGDAVTSYRVSVRAAAPDGAGGAVPVSFDLVDADGGVLAAARGAFLGGQGR